MQNWTGSLKRFVDIGAYSSNTINGYVSITNSFMPNRATLDCIHINSNGNDVTNHGLNVFVWVPNFLQP